MNRSYEDYETEVFIESYPFLKDYGITANNLRTKPEIRKFDTGLFGEYPYTFIWLLRRSSVDTLRHSRRLILVDENGQSLAEAKQYDDVEKKVKKLGFIPWHENEYVWGQTVLEAVQLVSDINKIKYLLLISEYGRHGLRENEFSVIVFKVPENMDLEYIVNHLAEQAKKELDEKVCCVDTD